MSGLFFLGWTSTKQGLMCLAQGHKAVTPVRLKTLQPLHLESSTLPLSHCAPQYPHSWFENSVDLDQLASKKPADQDPQCFPLCF